MTFDLRGFPRIKGMTEVARDTVSVIPAGAGIHA